jgi:hypothetical protein
VRRTPLKAVPPVDRSGEPGYRAWKAPVFGCCALCGGGSQRLERHHCMSEQHVRAIDPAKVWDIRNSLVLGMHCSARCHSRHTTAAARLPASLIPAPAIEFMIELVGAERADLYIDRYYSPR